MIIEYFHFSERVVLVTGNSRVEYLDLDASGSSSLGSILEEGGGRWTNLPDLPQAARLNGEIRVRTLGRELVVTGLKIE